MKNDFQTFIVWWIFSGVSGVIGLALLNLPPREIFGIFMVFLSFTAYNLATQ